MQRLNFAVTFALVLAVACGGPNEKDAIHVTAYAPSDTVDDPKAAIRITFDKPIVASEEVGKTLASPPVNISPKVSVRAHWLDRQTLVVKPVQSLARATRYTVGLNSALEGRLAQTFSFSFVHDPLDIQGVRGVEPQWLSPRPTFTLAFDQAVIGGEVVEHCKLVSDDGEAVALTTQQTQVVADSIVVSAAKQLTQGAGYMLRCSEVRPKQGNSALQKPYELQLHVVPPLTLVKTTPEPHAHVTPDDLTISLQFSSPVEIEQLVKHVQLEPRHRGFATGFVQRGDTEVEVTLTLEADTDYVLKIGEGLQDRLGQKLTNAQTVRFTTTDAAPSLSLERGIYAIEASAGGYPIWSRNVPSFDVDCAHVPAKRIVAMLTSDVNYEPWYSESGSEALAWAKLALKPRHIAMSPESAKNKWARTQLDLPKACGAGKRGLYLAEVRSSLVEQKKKSHHGVYPFRVLGNVTDLGVMLKVGPAAGLVWVASLSSAAPVFGASISLYAPTGERVWTGTTDERGLAITGGSSSLLKAPVDGDPEGVDDVYRDQRLIAVVEKGDDLAVVDGYWQNGIEAWNFGFDVDRSGSDVRVRGFLESDRGIYRPGETVHLKGIARELALDGSARVPSKREIGVKVEDGQGAAIFQENLTLSEFGGFHFDVALGPEAATGDYYVTATLGKQRFRQTFSVEEIKPVTFEIEASRAPQSMKLRASTKLALTARYLFGAPVAGARVSYQIDRRQKSMSFPGYDQYSFSDWSEVEWTPWWESDRYSDFVSEATTETDEAGRFSVTVHDDSKELNSPQDYLVRATVRDSADQEVTKTLVIAAHPTDFYLGVQPVSWVQKVDVPFGVQALAIAPDGTRVGSDAELVLERVRWECGTRDNPYGYGSCQRRRTQVDKRKVKIAAEGVLLEQLVAKTPGEFVVRVEAKDSKGKPVRASSSVWVIGLGETSWGSDLESRIDLIASKKSYAPGEVALVVPQTSTEGATMLVTIERNGILETRVETTNEASTGLSIPITEAHAPNVYVSVAVLRGRRGDTDGERPQLKLGIANLPVTFAKQRLKVQVVTEATDFEPGQPVQGKLVVTNHDGSPARAEVALSAADEGVLQLIAYETPDPLTSMYAPWGLGIETSSNWNRVLRQQNAPQGGEGEEGSDSGGSHEGALRSRFVASAYWNPSLVTDEKGEARFEFKAPDNLTAFRIMAAAADAGMRFGSADARIRVRKDLTILPILPRFVTIGDKIEIGAVVHNYTGERGSIEVRIDLQGAEPRQKVEKVSVAPNGEAVVKVPVTVTGVDALQMKAHARLGTAKDGLLQVVPIEHPHVKTVETLFDDRGTRHDSVSLSWADSLDAAQSSVEVTVDRTGLASLAPGLRYLIRYPYGCLEQTMSALVPLLKVRDLAVSLEVQELQGEKLDTYIKLGIAKVIRHQQPDGHFSLWPGSRSYPHLTVYALWGLNEAKRAGVRVEKRALELGLDALRGWVNDGARTLGPGDETATMAMAAFVLADLGQVDPGLNARLFAARGALPTYGKAFLLRAMARAKAPVADLAALTSELEASVDTSKQGAVVRERLKYDAHYWGSDARSTAMVLSALLERAPAASLVPRLVSGLRGMRSESRWESTQDNMYALVALSDYARSEAGGQADVTIRLGDEVIAKQTLKGSAVLRVQRTLAKVARGSAFRVEASAPVQALAVITKVTPELRASAVDHGFDVRRDYLDVQTERPVSEAKIGDLVKVRVRISSAAARRYVAVSDPLPSGFASVNTRLATESDANDVGGQWMQWDHRALRDERTDWFIDDMTQGERVLEYVMRATHAGSFSAAPTRVEEMYTPHVMGHAASTVLTVTR